MRSRVSALEPQQLELIKDLDTKFECIIKELEAKPMPLGNNQRTHGLLNFYVRTLQVYNVLFNKYMMNDDFLMMRVENILKYKIGEDLL